MPYTLPTSDDFLTRFPEFAGTDDDLITQLINDAARFVDTTWLEADYQPAILYMAAHMLTLGNAAAIGGGGASDLSTLSVAIGGITQTFGKTAAAASAASTAWTSGSAYGERFAILRDLNNPAILVLNGDI